MTVYRSLPALAGRVCGEHDVLDSGVCCSLWTLASMTQYANELGGLSEWALCENKLVFETVHTYQLVCLCASTVCFNYSLCWDSVGQIQILDTSPMSISIPVRYI